MWGAAAQRLATTAGRADLPLVVLGFAIGFALADLVTGITHWLCDRVFDERAPIFGPLIVKAFREHHTDPLGITRHGFLGVNGNAALAATPVLALAWLLLAPATATSAALFVWAIVVALAIGAVATNQFHAWAHAEHVPPAIAWLQRKHLLLSPRAHAVHHDHGFDRSYCVTTGWWNPLLDRIRLFSRLEARIAARARAERIATRS